MVSTSRSQIGRPQIRKARAGWTFIVDFVCRNAMLAIEVDGATHSSETEVSSDRRREQYLIRSGYRITRFANEEVYRQLNSVLETILAHIERRG